MATTDSNQTASTAQPASSNPEDVSSSQEVKITKADWDKVQAALGRIADLQSGKDIAKQTKADLSKLRDDVLPLLERAHQLGSQDKPLEEALNQIQSEQSDAEFRQAVFEIAKSLRSDAQPTSAGNTPGVDLTATLAAYKLDPKDPYVATQLQGKQFASQTDAELFAARVFRDKQLTPNPNLAQGSTTPATEIQTDSGADEKIARLTELQKMPTKNREEIRKLKAELNATDWK